MKLYIIRVLTLLSTVNIGWLYISYISVNLLKLPTICSNFGLRTASDSSSC